MKKKVIYLMTVIFIFISTQVFVLANDAVQPMIVLDGVELQAHTYIDSGEIYLPLRAIGEALGYDIQWSGKDRKIYISKEESKTVLDLKNNKITADGHDYFISGDYCGKLLSGFISKDGRTYVDKDVISDIYKLKVTKDDKAGTVMLESIKGNYITVKTVKEASDNGKIKITIQYPQFDGLADSSVQDTINAVFKKSALDAKAEGLKNLKDYSESTGVHKLETYFNYGIKYNSEGLLSMVFMDYQDAGGAHGGLVQSSHTFNLKTGEEYTLKDLMKSDVDYVSIINSSVRNEIDERAKNGLVYENKTFKTINADQVFYLSNSALMIYFEEYEYFPYASLIQEFPVEYTLLAGVLKPEFNYLYSDSVLLRPSPELNSLKVADCGIVVLRGNPTTGYSWHYTIENNEILKLESESSLRESDLIGAGSIFSWSFKALKEGKTKIVFKYYRDWEGEETATPNDIIEYIVDIKPAK